MSKKENEKEGKKEWVSPFAQTGHEYMGTRENAAYRQRYLRMYNPMQQTRAEECVHEKANKWFSKSKAKTSKLWKHDVQSDHSSPSGSTSITKIFLSFFFACRGRNQVTKTSAVTPVVDEA